MTIGFIFSSAPFGSAEGREGLDAVLAASNFTDELALFFIGDGVMQLIDNQASDALLCKNHIKMFKMLPMCDVEKVYLCQDSLNIRGLNKATFVLDVELLSAKEMTKKMTNCNKILRF